MAGLLSDILGFIDRAKQSAKANVGLLVSDPREYFMSMEDQARENNRLGALAIQAERNAARGLPVTPEQAAAKQYVDQKTAEIALGFAGTTKVGKTPFELAHETAQANAVKMLGLPPGNTAMDRAKALGFDTPAYHGSNKDLQKFSLNEAASKTGNVNANLGIFSTPNSSEGSRYAMAWGTEGGNVLPLFLRNGKQYNMSFKELDDLAMLPFRKMVNDPSFDPNAKVKFGDLEAQKQAAQRLQEYRRQAAEDVVNRRQELISDGYDSAVVLNGKPMQENITFDPKNIRSRFAAFDPARINEPDLLAAGIPLGLIANTEVDIPKKKKKAK